MLVTINLTGGSYKFQSLPVSAQVTKNFWPRLVDDPIVKNKYILTNFVGQKLFGSVAGEVVGRGTYYFNSVLYRVVSNNLYSVDINGIHTSLAVVPGNDKCIFDNIGDDLIIVTDRRVFVFDGTGIVENVDPDLESPNSCTVINNQVIYDGNNGRFGVTDVGDPLSIDGLNYATAESRSDDLIRVYAFDQVVYMFGTITIEQWWNSGVGKPPFDRIEGGIIDKIGLGALFGVTSCTNGIYFFGSDKKIYALKGSTKDVVSTDVLADEFQSYAIVSDMEMFCIEIGNTNFIVATFPSADKTWVYIEGGQWFQWSSGDEDGRNVADSCVRAYGKNLVEDYRNGNLYELDLRTYTENGDTIIRVRDSAPLDGAIFGYPGAKITMNRLILNIEKGVGLISGQGSDPVVMLSYSDDGGNTFSNEIWATIGKMGNFKWGVQFNCLGTFETRIIRIRTSDPVYFCIRDCVVDIEVGI